MKSVLLVIDPQNDFVNPEGTLYVPGSEKAIKRLCNWLENNWAEIDDIILTQDSHTSFHISHSMFWLTCPPALTIIEPEDIETEKQKPLKETNEVLKYIKEVKEIGRNHTIWPEHCILGSWGWSFPDKLVDSLNIWTLKKKGTLYKVVQKGLSPWKEAYSIFSFSNKEMTKEGEDLLKELDKYDQIFIAGFAKDYCVAFSVEDLVDKGYSNKLIFLESCMSSIDPDNQSLKIYEKAKENGAKSA